MQEIIPVASELSQITKYVQCQGGWWLKCVEWLAENHSVKDLTRIFSLPHTPFLIHQKLCTVSDQIKALKKPVMAIRALHTSLESHKHNY